MAGVSDNSWMYCICSCQSLISLNPGDGKDEKVRGFGKSLIYPELEGSARWNIIKAPSWLLVLLAPAMLFKGLWKWSDFPVPFFLFCDNRTFIGILFSIIAVKWLFQV